MMKLLTIPFKVLRGIFLTFLILGYLIYLLTTLIFTNDNEDSHEISPRISLS